MKRASDCAGTAAIEFGIIAPFLLALLAGIVELGFGGYQAMRVADAAEAGAVYAAKYGFDSAGIQAAVVNSVGTGSGVTATPAPSEFCGCPGTSGFTVIICGAKCSDGTTPGTYIQVSATVPHSAILPFLVPLPDTMTWQTTVRVN